MTNPTPFADYMPVKSIRGNGTRYAQLWRAIRAGRNSIEGQHCIRYFDTAKGGEVGPASYGLDPDYLVNAYASSWIASEPALWAIYSADGADNRDLIVVACTQTRAVNLWRDYYTLDDETPDSVIRLPATPHDATEKAVAWDDLKAA